jgi:hypothetical protein
MSARAAVLGNPSPAIGFGARRRTVAGVLVCALVFVACFVAAQRLTGASWPLEGANLTLVGAAAAAYLVGFGLRAFGWRRLFPAEQRPGPARCLAACGASAASGTVLPFRLDYVVKIATLRRLRGVPVGLDTVALSIVALGLVDAVAILPLALAALTGSHGVFVWPLLLVVLVCTGAGIILLAGRRLLDAPLVRRWAWTQTVCSRVGADRSTLVAGIFVCGCWTARAVGSTFLLAALGTGFDPRLALVVLCLAAAAAAVPITAGGAVAGMGASAAILVTLDVPKNVAVNFSLASASLITLAALAAALVGATASVLGDRRAAA